MRDLVAEDAIQQIQNQGLQEEVSSVYRIVSPLKDQIQDLKTQAGIKDKAHKEQLQAMEEAFSQDIKRARVSGFKDGAITGGAVVLILGGLACSF